MQNPTDIVLSEVTALSLCPRPKKPRISCPATFVGVFDVFVVGGMPSNSSQLQRDYDSRLTYPAISRDLHSMCMRNEGVTVSREHRGRTLTRVWTRMSRNSHTVLWSRLPIAECNLVWLEDKKL